MILNGTNDPLEIFWRHLTYPYVTFNLHCGSGTVGVCDPFIFLVISNSGNETPSGGVGWIPRKGRRCRRVPKLPQNITMFLEHQGWNISKHILKLWHFKCPTQDCSHLPQACSCFGGDLQQWWHFAPGEAALTVPSLHRLGIECLLLHCRSPCRSYLPFGRGRSRPGRIPGRIPKASAQRETKAGQPNHLRCLGLGFECRNNTQFKQLTKDYRWTYIDYHRPYSTSLHPTGKPWQTRQRPSGGKTKPMS